MPSQTITASDTIDGVPVTTTTTVPEYATDSITISHDVSLGAQDNSDINIALAIDTSGSTAWDSGSDVDGDGDNDTYLEAQQLAAKELFEAYVAAGYDPSRVTITLVEYGSSGTVLGIFNLDDQAAFNAAVDGLDSSGSTNFEDPLQDIYGSWSSQGVDPTANNTVIFLSDGMQNSGGTFTDDASALSSTFGANISAIGVGVNSSLSQLNQMDNTGGAVKVTNVADILNEITSPPPILDVNSVTVELSYVDANNNPHTFSYTYDINNAPITPTPTGYNINGHEIDFNPLPLAGTNIDVTVTTSFNNGADSISTGIIAVPAYTCFSADVLIMTDRGEVRAGDLVAGDMVMTFDNGLQPLLWVGKRAVAPEMLRSLPKICPIRIKAGALGPYTPQRDMVVSPQHRILVASAIAERMFGCAEVLVAAKHLLDLEGVERAEDLETVEYVHFAFERHELVFSDGAISESLFAGQQALNMMLPEQREELLTIFPEWDMPDFVPVPVREIPKGARQKHLVARHQINEKALAKLN